MATADTPDARLLPLVEGRDVAALQDPRPVCLIGACDEAGKANFATVIWVTPVSHKPPMIAFALREKSHTMQLIRASGVFSIATLPATADAVEAMEFCGGNTGRLVDKGAAVPHFTVPVEPASRDDAAPETAPLVPVCDIATSWVTAAVDSIAPAGDHLLVVGTVREAHTGAPRDARGQLIPHDTLLCVQHGTYATDEVLRF